MRGERRSVIASVARQFILSACKAVEGLAMTNFGRVK
jgi:hypothetical protein